MVKIDFNVNFKRRKHIYRKVAMNKKRILVPLGTVLRVNNVQNIVNVKARKATETKIIFYSQAEKKSCIPAVTIKIGSWAASRGGGLWV